MFIIPTSYEALTFIYVILITPINLKFVGLHSHS